MLTSAIEFFYIIVRADEYFPKGVNLPFDSSSELEMVREGLGQKSIPKLESIARAPSWLFRKDYVHLFYMFSFNEQQLLMNMPASFIQNEGTVSIQIRLRN